MLKTTILVLALTLPFVYSCKKEGCTDASALNYSESAEKDDGSCITTQEVQSTDSDAQNLYVEEFTITFDNSNYFRSYNTNFDYEPGDIIVLELRNKYNDWSPLPFIYNIDVHIQGSYDENGELWYFLYEDSGTPHYPTNSITIDMRAALIKKNGLESNPNLENMTIAELESELKE